VAPETPVAEAPMEPAAIADASDFADVFDAPELPFLAIAPCADPAVYVTGVTSVATTGSSYSPMCLRVPVGTSVTIEASIEHPLQPRPGGTPGNPIEERQHTASVVFSAPGVFPFQCPEHLGDGMIGVIWVR
jgi:plastocyanin